MNQAVTLNNITSELRKKGSQQQQINNLVSAFELRCSMKAEKEPLAFLKFLIRENLVADLGSPIGDTEKIEDALTENTLDEEMPSSISHFRFIRKIGQGGMGRVYLVFDEEIRRHVTIKMCHPKNDDDVVRQRFKREAILLGHLNHPNIVKIHHSFTENEVVYHVLEYISGQTLADVIENEKATQQSVDLREKLSTLLQCLRALEHVHAHAMVHRDIKPQNILIRDITRQALLTDFGIGKFLYEMQKTKDIGRLTVKNEVIGSAGYMSPEQAAGKTIDERTDIFSLGATFFEYVTLQPLIPGDNEWQLFKNYEAKKMHRIKELMPNIPEPVSQFFDEITHQDLMKRYQNCHKAITDLEKILLGDAINT